MKFKTPVAILLTAIIAPAPALAGVVFQVETTYHTGAPGVESSEMSVEKPNLKMEIAASRDEPSDGPPDVAIFNGERRQMVVVDHREKAYMVVDSATVGRIDGQIQGQMQQAMKELEKHMEGLDPKQREMMEQMLKGKMGASGGAGAAAAGMPKLVAPEFRRTGERGVKQGYPCVRYDVLLDGEKIQELWVTDWNNIQGGDEVAGAFLEMADFWKEIAEAFSSAGGGFFKADRNPIDSFTKINGFPVVTRSFEGGELESETVLRSVSERDLDPDAFEPPKGYRLRTMGPQ